MNIGSTFESGTKVYKRKFRWAFLLKRPIPVLKSGNHSYGAHIVRISSRPEFNFDEQEVQHISEKVYLPAKAFWNPIKITVFDLENESYLYDWLKLFYDPEKGNMQPVAGNKGLGELYLYDGLGNPIEYWEIQGCWPQSIVWGELDYSTSDLVDTSFTCRYDRAVKKQ